MELKHVIISVDSNPSYTEFWDLCSLCWNKGIGIKPTLVVVDPNPNSVRVSSDNGEVIRVRTTGKYSPIRYASIARIWGILKYPDEMCTVGDIDLLPLGKEFFKLNLNENAFTWLYNQRYLVDKRYFACYFTCTGRLLSWMFQVPPTCTLDEFIDAMHKFGSDTWNSRRRLARIRESGYGFDEVALTARVDQLEAAHELKVDIVGSKTPNNRMWRGLDFPTRFKQWERGIPMIDMHCHRPYGENMDLIHYIVNKQFGWKLPVKGVVKPYKYSIDEVL